MGDSSKSLVSGEILVKATGAEIITGTNDAKFTTPKGLADAGVEVEGPSASAVLYLNTNFGGF